MQLAHVVNADNALSMFNVVERGIPAAHPSFGEVTFSTRANCKSAASLVAYANRYAPLAAPLDSTLRFTPYDWTVANSRPAP